jgi:hypothetical protein
VATEQSQSLGNVGQALVSDVERVLGQRLGRFREEIVDELGKMTAAGTSLGGGLGLAALGTVLGGIGFVHLVHKATGLPLWLCYAGASATACAVGSGMLTAGVKKVGELDVIPEGAQRLAGDVAQRAAEHAGVAG